MTGKLILAIVIMAACEQPEHECKVCEVKVVRPSVVPAKKHKKTRFFRAPEQEERADAAWIRCVLKHGTGSCHLIEQHGVFTCYRPGVDAESMKRCFANMVSLGWVEDYMDDCYPDHLIGQEIGEGCGKW